MHCAFAEHRFSSNCFGSAVMNQSQQLFLSQTLSMVPWWHHIIAADQVHVHAASPHPKCAQKSQWHTQNPLCVCAVREDLCSVLEVAVKGLSLSIQATGCARKACPAPSHHQPHLLTRGRSGSCWCHTRIHPGMFSAQHICRVVIGVTTLPDQTGHPLPDLRAFLQPPGACSAPVSINILTISFRGWPLICLQCSRCCREQSLFNNDLNFTDMCCEFLISSCTVTSPS